MYKGSCWQEDWPSKNTSSVCTQDQEDTHRGCAGRDVYVRSIGTGAAGGWRRRNGERLELIGCKQTGAPGQEIHYFCPSIIPHVTPTTVHQPHPRTSTTTVVLPLLFPFPMPLGFLPLPSTSSRLYSLQDGNSPFPTHPLFLLFLYISRRI